MDFSLSCFLLLPGHRFALRLAEYAAVVDAGRLIKVFGTVFRDGIFDVAYNVRLMLCDPMVHHFLILLATWDLLSLTLLTRERNPTHGLQKLSILLLLQLLQ